MKTIKQNLEQFKKKYNLKLMVIPIILMCFSFIFQSTIYAQTHPILHVDAILDASAVPNKKNKVYFFVGDSYYRFDISKNKVDAGYPGKLSAFKGLKNYPGKADFSKDLDAAVNRDNKHAYFFKGDYYVKYDFKSGKVMSGYPAKIKGAWKNLPDSYTSNIDAASSNYNGDIYFFKGNEYIKYSVNKNKVHSGYPANSADKWDFKSSSFGTSVKAAFRVNTTDRAYLWDNKGKYFKFNFKTLKKYSSYYPADVTNSNWNFGTAQTKSTTTTAKTNTTSATLAEKTLYKIGIKSSKGNVLDVSAASMSNSTSIIKYSDKGLDNQKFYLKNAGGGYYYIYMYHSNKVIDASKKSSKISQYDYHGGDNQKWKLTNRGDGYYSIQSKQTGKVFDLNAKGKLGQYGYHGGDNQLFKFTKVAGTPKESIVETGFRVKINGLNCLQSADDGNGTDEPYFEIWADGKKVITTKSRPMNEADRSWWEHFTDAVESTVRIAQQEFWLLPGSVYAEKEVIIKLYEEDDGRGNSAFVNNDDYIGQVVITNKTANSNYIRKEFRSEEEGNWDLVYSKSTRTFDPTKTQGRSKKVTVRVPILDQGNEGACVAFGTVGALTTAYLNKTKPGTSKEDLFDSFALYDRRSNKPQSGWNVYSCLAEIMRNGIPFKSGSKRLYIKNFYKYEKDGTVRKYFLQDNKVKSNIIEQAGNNGYNKMRKVLDDGEPLIATYRVYPDFTAYAGIQGVYGGQIANINEVKTGGHAIFVVGYNNPAYKSHSYPTWVLQNSWNSRWGKNGLCEFTVGACHFDDDMYKIGDFEVR